jgi:alanine-glyoxylate transaminase/serine-glyoxylate transaminase/serine-pyruvate transaminase
MASNRSRTAGRHFLQIPGPTPLPDRILRAMDMPIIDHRGPEFARLARRVLDGIKTIFKTRNPVIIYPSSGTGAWEAALVNALSPGDSVLMFETGQFGDLHRIRLANRRRPEGDRGETPRGQGAQDQGGRRPAQRDVNRLRLAPR